MDRDKKHVHSKTIIHIKIDNFFSKVRPIDGPYLESKPVGAYQKGIIVARNTLASKFGIEEFMHVGEALKLCSSLLLLDCSDLHEYLEASNQIYLFLLSFTNQVERLSFNENCLDITELVAEKESKADFLVELFGHGIGEKSKTCSCGCQKRLSIGSQIAFEIRKKLHIKLGFTSCCGISYNKTLAKSSCSASKPNQQTTFLPIDVIQILMRRDEVDFIPGIQKKIKSSKGMNVMENLQRIKTRNFERFFDDEKDVINLMSGGHQIFSNQVECREKSNSFFLQDEIKKYSEEFNVKETFRILLNRLLILMEKSGRIPMAVKIMVRKHEANNRMANRETRQSPLPGSLFTKSHNKLNQISINKILDIIMKLFRKITNKARPFHITLLGLAFSKFSEKSINCSVASFLLTKEDLSIQSLTSFFMLNEKLIESSNASMLYCSERESESEPEPSAKKTKLDL